jgi:TRAP transporter TAXI family solute receptor
MKKLLVILFALFALASLGAQDRVFVNIGTGGTAGTYYPLGGAMAELISKAYPYINATAVSTGASVANVNKLVEGEFQLVMVQNDVTYYAFNGIEMFKDNAKPNLRGVGTLYGETIQIVTVSSSKVKSLNDLRGKRIAVGAAGSGTEVNCRQILEALGLSYKDVSPQYLNFAEAANGLRDGNVDVAVVTAGVPTAAIRDVASQKDVVILPVSNDLARKLIAKYPFYTKFLIPKDTYPKQGSDVQTLAVKAMLLVDATADDQLVYDMTKAIFTGTERLAMAHAQGANIKKASAQDGMPIPLHPGAKKFFEE